MTSDNVLRRYGRYLPLGVIDADDLRQEIAVAELLGADASNHVWTMLQRHLRRDMAGAVEERRHLDDDAVSGHDLINRLRLPDDVAAEVRSLYDTGEYPESLRQKLQRAGCSLNREAYV